MTDSSKVLLIGWDAADWKIIHPLIDAGKMPVLEKMISEGTMGNLTTIQPVLSPMLWTSIATGKRPFKHGILGFTEPDPVTGKIRPITNLSRRTKAVWNILSQNGLRSNVVGWWPSYPAEPINGVMISNHYHKATGRLDDPWPMAPGTVHPTRLESVLKEVRYHPEELEPEHVLPFIPNAAKIDQEKDRRFSTFLQILAECTTINGAATLLMQNEPWDFMAVYFDAIDHFGHAFMKYHPPRRAWISETDYEMYKGVVEGGYRYHDLMLATLLRLAGEDTTVILMSDHGFHPDHLRPRSIPTEPAGPAVEHRDLGIFVAKGPGIRSDHIVFGASVLDICPTILTLFGLPVGEDMDGKPLVDVYGDPQSASVHTIGSWDEVNGADGSHSPDRKIDPVEAKEAIDRLVALGYIEQPSENQDRAVENTVRELRYNLARSLMDANLLEDAEAIYRELHERWPDEHRFGVQRALCLRALRDAPALREVVETLISRRLAEAAEAQAALSAISDKDKGDDDPKPSERRSRLRLLSQANPDLFALQQLRSWVDLAEKRFDEALDRLAQTSVEYLDRPQIPLMRGEIHLAKRDWDQALTAFSKALQTDPENAAAYLGQSRAFLGKREPLKAVDAACAALGLSYYQPQAHFLHGIASYRAGDWRRAAEAFEVAVQQNPNYVEAYVRLAFLYTRRLSDPSRGEHYRTQALRARRYRREYEVMPRWERHSVATISNVTAPFVAEEEPARDLGPLTDHEILIVSGLPRSGTSMTMQILDAGDIPILTDGKRSADESNPRGYFEYRPATRLRSDSSWLRDAQGHAVKIVAQLLPLLPSRLEEETSAQTYRVILVDRHLDEILASQEKMLAARNAAGSASSGDQLRAIYGKQLTQVRHFLMQRKIPWMTLSYESAICRPKLAAAKINRFLGGGFDESAMAAAVDPALYRERRPV